jgi:crotonobetainyl-CoA:carnitine CoA-transferase CaiB-like acyl-CoA transferase
MAALGLLAKVHEGRGGQVDVSLFDTMLSQLNYKAAAYLNGAPVPPRQRAGAHTFYVPAQLFETADGYLALFVTHDRFWRLLCDEIGESDWGSDPRFATMHARFDNRETLLALLGERLCESTAREWAQRLRPLGLAVGAVVGLDEALDSEYVRTRGMVVDVPTEEGPLYLLGNPIRFDDRAVEYRPPPRLHEHTAELFGDQGEKENR